MLLYPYVIALLIFLSQPLHAQGQTYALAGSTDLGAIALSFANGQSEVITVTDQGWWSPTEQNFLGNTNVIVGSCFGVQWNDFFVFDLTGRSGTVVAASLDLNTGLVSGMPSLTLWDVSTPLATLENLNAAPNAAIYADLESGTRYSGTQTISTGGTSIAIPLNSTGIAAVNQALGGTLAIGGSAEPIPEPAPIGAIATVLSILAALRYRARQATKRSALSYASRSTARASLT